MTKQRAIYLKCLDCSADDRKEVLLCTLFDCPLWPYRCGCHISSSRYRDRIGRAFRTFTRIVAELRRDGLAIADFLRNDEPASHSTGKRGKKVSSLGEEAVQGKVPS